MDIHQYLSEIRQISLKIDKNKPRRAYFCRYRIIIDDEESTRNLSDLTKISPEGLIFVRNGEIYPQIDNNLPKMGKLLSKIISIHDAVA